MKGNFLFKRFSTNFTLLAVFFDSLVLFSFFYIVNSAFFGPSLVPGSISIHFHILVVVFGIVSFFHFGIYDGRRNFLFLEEILKLVFGILSTFVFACALAFMLDTAAPIPFLLTYLAATFLAVALFRMVARIRWRMDIRRGYVSKVIIVGAGDEARMFQKHILEHPSLRKKVIGFLSDDTSIYRRPLKVMGPISMLRQLAKQNQVDEVIIALPLRNYSQIIETVASVDDLNIPKWVVPPVVQLTFSHFEIHDFEGIPLIGLHPIILTEYQRLVKRILDLTIATSLVVLTLPLMLIIALMIKIDSTGPIIFSQTRVGEGRKLFKIFKFRTMFENSKLEKSIEIDPGTNPMHKVRGDPRVTKFGRLIRRFSLDELPQLFNVLRGDMSMVGPRPELVYLVDKYDPWQRVRFLVPQGITGWWQVNGRSDKPMHANTELDIYYIQNYSLLLDLVILVKTPFAAIKGVGAF